MTKKSIMQLKGPNPQTFSQKKIGLVKGLEKSPWSVDKAEKFGPYFLGGLDWGTSHDLRVGGQICCCNFFPEFLTIAAGPRVSKKWYLGTCKQTHASDIIMASTKSNHHDVEEAIICFLSWRNSMFHFHLNV